MHDLTAHPIFINGLAFLTAALLILLLVRFAQYVATASIENGELRYKTRKALGLAGYLLGLIIGIAIFSDQIGNLAVIIGALSVGIGFALRELIQNLIGWGAISFGNLYKPGDRIQLGNNMGDVMDIGPLSTTLMECGGWVNSDLYNGRVVHVPNNLVLRESVVNYTPDFPFLWDEIVIPVRSDSDHKLARTLIESVGKSVQAQIAEAAHEAWTNFVRYNRAGEAGLESVVTLKFDANWIEFTLRYITDYRVRRSTQDKLYSAILEQIEATGGKVQIATPPLRVTHLPAMNAPEKPYAY